jgi:hypothetical protein
MKVFMCKRQGGYSGGLAVVAANSVEEAFKTFFEDTDYGWMVDKYDDDTGKFTDDCTKWHSYYYPIENWFECKVLTANVKNPCVIMEDGYTE